MKPRETISTTIKSAISALTNDLPGAEEILKSLLESFPDAVLVVDPRFQVLATNATAQRLLGLQNASGKSLSTCLEINPACFQPTGNFAL
jgi:PAS domain-containing protein